MQFNSHSDEQDIVSYVVDATGLNPTAHLKKITRAANEALRIIWSWIFEAYGGWQFDDGNQTDLPSATAALVASQQKYTLPSEALTVRRVSVKDESGFWRDLDPITLEEITATHAENEFQSTPGNPTYYRLVAGILKLYPGPSYGQDASLRVQFDRGTMQFVSTDTTKTPGFASEFHGAVPTGAAVHIGGDKTLKNTTLQERRWARYELAIKGFYKKRFAEMNPETHRSQVDDPAAEVI
ncbi:phage adaptor protein [Amorphus orientalis]|uniref:Uncharacterized protein n=1 Tax=Amorphus orientalis TaxID=649198 RepID=A0AAE3VQM6_9HYPH|nr:hypothetical protein [Amorphus orientalis]MDQ0316400.1 hypothetical protein [Amorphus orientalis]